MLPASSPYRNFNTSKGKKYSIRIPKSELYYYYIVFTAGIVPYVSPVANGYSDICRAYDIYVRIPFNVGDIYVALPLTGLSLPPSEKLRLCCKLRPALEHVVS